MDAWHNLGDGVIPIRPLDHGENPTSLRDRPTALPSLCSRPAGTPPPAHVELTGGLAAVGKHQRVNRRCVDHDTRSVTISTNSRTWLDISLVPLFFCPMGNAISPRGVSRRNRVPIECKDAACLRLGKRSAPHPAWTLLFLLTLSRRAEGRHFSFWPSGSSKAVPLPNRELQPCA
jgi:hypothetical protein